MEHVKIQNIQKECMFIIVMVSIAFIVVQQATVLVRILNIRKVFTKCNENSQVFKKILGYIILKILFEVFE